MEQFKVGDYVRHKASKSVHKCISINIGLFKNEIVVTPLRSFNPQYMDNYEPWYPKEDEWCWFYDDDGYMLSKYEAGNKEDGFKSTHLYHFIWTYTGPKYKQEPIYHTKVWWRYCEPFTDQLPSFIKER